MFFLLIFIIKMITFKYLKLLHFMCVDNAELDLNSKLIIFEGNNGQGKSSIMEAIALCFCEHKRSDSVKELIQKGNEHAYIELHLDYNGEMIIFNVSLNERHGTPFERDVLYKGKHYINSEVTELLDSLNFKFFSEIILSMQGQDDVTLMTPTQRADLLQNLFQFDFDDKIKEMNAKLDELSTNSLLLKEKEKFLVQEIKQKENRKSELSTQILPVTQKEIDALKKEKEDCSSQIEQMNAFIVESGKLHQRKNELLNEKMKLNLNQFLYKEADAKKSKKTLENLDYETKSSKLKEEISKATDNIQKLKLNKTTLENDINSLNEKIIKIKENKNLSLVKLQNVIKKIDLAKKGVCPECGQTTCNIDQNALFSEKISYEENCAKNDDDVKQLQNNIATIRNQIINVDKNINEVNISLQSLKVTFTSLDNEKTLCTSKIMSEDDWLELQSSIAAAYDKEREIDTEIKDIESKILSYNDKVTTRDTVQQRKDELKKMIDSYDTIKQQNASIETQRKFLNEEIVSSNKELEKVRQNLVQCGKDIETYEEVKKILSRELPNYLIVKTCSKLEAEMNSFVQIVFPNFQLRLLQSRKGVEFFYSLKKDEDMSNIKQLINSKMASGYERAVLGIAFKAALCKAYGLTFAAFDEIDQAASDENSVKTFESLIYSNIFNQIFVITHKNATKEALKQLEDSSISYHVSKGRFTLNETEDD